jgi:hypothetical protein
MESNHYVYQPNISLALVPTSGGGQAKIWPLMGQKGPTFRKAELMISTCWLDQPEVVGMDFLMTLTHSCRFID